MTTKKTVLITGAGGGIGRATAQCLSKSDYSLLLLGRDLDSLEASRKSLEFPDAHQCISCDIRVQEDIGKALQKSKIPVHYVVKFNTI